MPLTIGTIGMPVQSTTVQSSQAAGGQEGQRQASLDKACRDFESLFVNYMLQQMRQTVPQDGMFSGGQAEKLYTSMMDQEVAKEITKQRGMGLAPIMYRQMMSGIDDETTKNKVFFQACDNKYKGSPCEKREISPFWGIDLRYRGASCRKLMGLSIQLFAQDEKKDQASHLMLKNRHTAYKKLVEKLHGQEGKEEMLDPKSSN